VTCEVFTPLCGVKSCFVIICAVTGRILIFLFATMFAAGDALDDTVGQWAKKISAHLAADEAAHVTWRDVGNNAASADASAALVSARAKALLLRALQRRLRNPKPVEVIATFSESRTEYMLIAEVRRENENIVEIASTPKLTAPLSPNATLRLDRRLVWEQPSPILDVTVIGDTMLVLDDSGITIYSLGTGSNGGVTDATGNQPREGSADTSWQKLQSIPLAIPPVRDLRGRLMVTADSAVAEVPGLTCRGTWKPASAFECQPGKFFTAGRNTIEEAGWPLFFEHVQIGGDHIVVSADGKTYLYDADRKQIATADPWEDAAAVSTACGGPKIIAQESVNSLGIFDLVNHRVARAGDSIEMEGPITALWPNGSGAIAVVRNKVANQYEAFSISVACGR